MLKEQWKPWVERFACSCCSPSPAPSHSAAAEEGYYTDTVVKRSTPILFSTNRGLHLRVPKTFELDETTTTMVDEEQEETSFGPRLCSSTAYDISFCDLERWSTNRANTVSLEDTFTISHPISPPVAAPPAARGPISTRSSNFSFIPVKRPPRLFSSSFDI